MGIHCRLKKLQAMLLRPIPTMYCTLLLTAPRHYQPNGALPQCRRSEAAAGVRPTKPLLLPPMYASHQKLVPCQRTGWTSLPQEKDLLSGDLRIRSARLEHEIHANARPGIELKCHQCIAAQFGFAFMFHRLWPIFQPILPIAFGCKHATPSQHNMLL